MLEPQLLRDFLYLLIVNYMMVNRRYPIVYLIGYTMIQVAYLNFRINRL